MLRSMGISVSATTRLRWREPALQTRLRNAADLQAMGVLTGRFWLRLVLIGVICTGVGYGAVAVVLWVNGLSLGAITGWRLVGRLLILPCVMPVYILITIAVSHWSPVWIEIRKDRFYVQSFTHATIVPRERVVAMEVLTEPASVPILQVTRGGKAGAILQRRYGIAASVTLEDVTDAVGRLMSGK